MGSDTVPPARSFGYILKQSRFAGAGDEYDRAQGGYTPRRMSLHVHRSNRTERLVDALARTVAQPLASVFQAEWVTVSSPGMERWLSMELGKRLGVWANPAFPFPRKLIETVLAAVLPDSEAQLAYDPTCMLFAIARLLRERADDPELAQPVQYCELSQPVHSSAEATRDRRRLALAQRLADLFDQYLTYRPELALGWEAGVGADPADFANFQGPLFRALAREYGPHHLPARARAVLRSLAKAGLPAGLPERLHLFGISTLPPLYLDVLAALAEHCEVHLFLLSPTREYYGDLRSARERKRRSRRQLSFGEAAFRSEPHALLASLGRHGREFNDLLEELPQYAEARTDLYEDPGTDSLLHALQADLLALRTRGQAPDELAPLPLTAADRSLSIHACHGPMREVEVLHDQLCELISAGVEPHEIIVMTPNIRDYAALIDAVFSQAEAQRPSIPFRIADRGAADSEPLIAALDALLDVLQSRFGANQVLDLLGLPLVRDRFGIAPDQVETLREWVEASGIRWGVDAAHRGEVGQPEFAENTWRFGLARLALGFSTGAAPAQLFAGVAPAAIDSADGALLGSFLEFCKQLFAFRIELRAAASAPVWSERLARLLGALLAGDSSSAAEHKLVRRALSELEQHAARADFDEAFDLTTLRALLTRTLSSRLPAHGFLSGGVTFCQLMPMRSIPFKVLCLLGMNDGVFPATDSTLAFDLMQRERKPGDRSRRDDDRQLFLEALLCARESLIITFIGQSLKDGKLLPPSVLVNELIDHVSQNFVLPDAANAEDAQAAVQRMERRLVLRHPLSAASPRYFGTDSDPRLFSFSSASCQAAAALCQPSRRRPSFSQLRSPEHDRLIEVSLADLERGLMRPSREFCQRRLALYLGDDLARVEEREPFALSHLERWQVASDLLHDQRRGDGAVDALTVLRAEGRLPLAAAGRLEQAALQADVTAILRALDETARSEPLPTLEVDLTLGGVRVTGRIDGLWSAGHVRAQYSKLNSRQELRHFIRHVVLRCVALQAPQLRLPDKSILIGRDEKGAIGTLHFVDIRDPAALLAELLRTYELALNGPLPLFPAASRGYAEALVSGKPRDLAIAQARRMFMASSSQDFGADNQDAYVQQLFTDFDVALEQRPREFEAAAERVYVPLFDHRRSP
jgi:exodeoxyribonuclease V gamma subunit